MYGKKIAITLFYILCLIGQSLLSDNFTILCGIWTTDNIYNFWLKSWF